MPIVDASSYRPSLVLRNAHLATILPSLLRVVPEVRFERQRLATPDADFLDLDWSRRGADRLAVLCHGLEGSTASPYIRGMTRTLNRRGWDVVALNFRGCSGQPNRQLRSYHSGVTEDLALVIDTVLQGRRPYRQLCLVGFSLGGNVLLKYLGDLGSMVPSALVGAVAVSVPIDLAACCEQLERRENWVYQWHFVQTLRDEYREKAQRFPDALALTQLNTMRLIRDFDEAYTAPVHGFADARDYWERCSSLPVLPRIAVPTLVISAEDDPFLPERCYPQAPARHSRKLHLATPRFGGHVGFASLTWQQEFWHERFAARFIDAHDGGG